MTKPIKNSGISVAASLNALQAGESVVFPKVALENTIRVTAIRIKHATGKYFKVNKQDNGSHIVTRVY